MSFLGRISSRKRRSKEQFAAEVRAAAKKLEENAGNPTVQEQELVLEQMRTLEGKIEMWEKKLAKHEAEKLELLTQLLPYKQKNMALPQTLKRKIAKCNNNIKVTSSQLSALEEKLSGMKQQFDNKEIIEAMDEANKVVNVFASTTERVENVMETAGQQNADLEDVSNAFILSNTASLETIDDNDLELQLAEYETENGIGDALAALHINQTDGLPLPKKIQSAASAAEDTTEIELRRLEKGVVV